MSAFASILDKSGALLLLLAALFIVMGQMAVLLLFVQEKRSRRQTAAATVHLLTGFLLFVFLLDSYDIVNYPQTQGASIRSEGILFRLPWLCYVCLEAFFAVRLALHDWNHRRYTTGTVTADAIRQAVDLLPEGICISAADGTIRLFNLKMDALCRELTGERPADARRLWAYLEEMGEDQDGRRLVHTPRSETWLFSKGTIAIDGRVYDRTSAVNVTERYRITEELRQKNAHLHDIQRRMKEAAELSGEMFVKQEAAVARSVLHNELGQVLLMGRYYLEHPDTTDAAMVALMTKQMNSFLLGESRAPGTDAGDELRQAVSMAGSIGVSVELCGEAPQAERQRALLGAAIRECAANTVKHAEGDKLFVRITESADGAVIVINNNGKPPKGPIVESGGLLSLRRGVEEAGGRMDVQSLPSFALTLSFPK